jgi:hypothetical protein
MNQFAAAYLAAFFLISLVPLGAAAILMLWICTGGAWGRLARPRLEDAILTIPWLCLLAIPLAFLAFRLYTWAADPSHARDYYHPWLVLARTLIVLALWCWSSLRLVGASRRAAGNDRAPPPLRAACAVGLVVYVLSVTVLSTDLVMSIEPDWHSSMLGVIVVCLQALAALAWTITALAISAIRAGRKRHDRLRDLGNLLLATVMLHAYVMFSQFFIIWNGNVPERTSWYESRVGPVWNTILALAALALFAIPFAAMLFRPLKRSPRAMAAVGAIVLAGCWLESAWLTIPSTRTGPIALTLYALLSIGALPLLIRIHPFRGLSAAQGAAA